MLTELQLYPGLRKAIDGLGFSQATDVQLATIPPALEGRDMLVCARTGTGKTLAYLLPLIQQLCANEDARSTGTLTLILLPTRELAQQVARETRTLISSTPLHCLLLTGGEGFRFQMAELRRNPEILIATPGRLLELMERQAVDLTNLKHLVLDEADRVLEMGFGKDVERIAEAANTSPQRQTLMLSATLGHAGIGSLKKALLHEPLVVNLVAEQQESIRHCIMLADDSHHKHQLLLWLLNHQEYQRCLVFANTRLATEQLFTLLRAQNLNAGVLHGEKQAEARKQIMTRFRHGGLKILVASDVAARGLDIADVEMVVNFNMPRKGDDYLHRVGRTGRAGRAGLAVSLIAPQEWDTMISIQRYLRIEFHELIEASLYGRFRGPKKVKSSGKTASAHKKKKGSKTDKKKPAAGARARTSTRKSLSGSETPRKKTS